MRLPHVLCKLSFYLFSVSDSGFVFNILRCISYNIQWPTMWRPTGDRMKTKRNHGWLWRIEGLRTDCKAHWGNVAGMLGYINKKKKIMNKNKNMWCWFNWHALGRVGFISCHSVGEGGLPPPLSGVKLKFASSFKIPVDTWHSNS